LRDLRTRCSGQILWARYRHVDEKFSGGRGRRAEQDLQIRLLTGAYLYFLTNHLLLAMLSQLGQTKDQSAVRPVQPLPFLHKRKSATEAFSNRPSRSSASTYYKPRRGDLCDVESEVVV
jgi:hypothetical protein